MDVVDTLRHQRSLVERELRSEDREQELIEKLKKIYAAQGLEVSDEVIVQGVRAMREERFVYRSTGKGVKKLGAYLRQPGSLGQRCGDIDVRHGGRLGRISFPVCAPGRTRTNQFGP